MENPVSRRILSDTNQLNAIPDAAAINARRLSLSFSLTTSLSERRAPHIPIAPHPMAWKMVQGPCPMKITFEARATIAARARARGAPKYAPVKITSTVTG